MIEKILNIENNERKTFKQHFLKGVVVAITFDREIKKQFVDGRFNDLFKSEGFSEVIDLQNASFKITIDEDIPTTEQTNSVIGYTYINPTNNNQIQLVNNKAIFVHNTYNNYESLNYDVQFFLSNIYTNLDVEIKQIGFRKINAIVVREINNYTDITDLFNDNLFNFMKCDLFDISYLENYRDNFTLAKNDTKIIINTACSKIKNIENSYEVIVDTDIIQNKIENNDNIKSIIEEMNQSHFDTFCWITSDKMKKIMDGVS